MRLKTFVKEVNCIM